MIDHMEREAYCQELQWNSDGEWGSGIFKQGKELPLKQANAFVAPQHKQKCYMKFTLESGESNESFLGGSAELSMVDMVELVSN